MRKTLLLAALLALPLAGHAATGLVMSCADASAAGKIGCTSRAWQTLQPGIAVMSAADMEHTAGAYWATEHQKYRLSTDTAAAVVLTCAANVNVGTTSCPKDQNKWIDNPLLKAEPPPVTPPPVVPPPLQAGPHRLSWSVPTTNIDGTPLTDLAGYIAHVRVPASVTSLAIDLPAGAILAGVRAVNSQGAESDRVQIQVTVAPVVAPPPPPPAVPKVAGIAGGTRAVYRATATGTRGTKAGDLAVGPVAADAALGLSLFVYQLPSETFA